VRLCICRAGGVGNGAVARETYSSGRLEAGPASRADYCVAALPSELNLTNISFPNNKGRAQRATKHLLLIVTLKPCSCMRQPPPSLAALLLVEPSGDSTLRKQLKAVACFLRSDLKFISIIYTHSIRTLQETYYVSAAKPNRLMLFGETVAVYCENHTEHINAFCGQDVEILNAMFIVCYESHCA
jgi:hypothetical protein